MYAPMYLWQLPQNLNETSRDLNWLFYIMKSFEKKYPSKDRETKFVI